jgi:hypothetical protein
VRPRAQDGVADPVHRGGRQVGDIRRFSDTCLSRYLAPESGTLQGERAYGAPPRKNTPEDVLTPEKRDKTRRVLIG